MDGSVILVIVIVALVFAGSMYFKVKFRDNVDTQENEKKAEKTDSKPAAAVNNSKKRRRKK